MPERNGQPGLRGNAVPQRLPTAVNGPGSGGLREDADAVRTRTPGSGCGGSVPSGGGPGSRSSAGPERMRGLPAGRDHAENPLGARLGPHSTAAVTASACSV